MISFRGVYPGGTSKKSPEVPVLIQLLRQQYGRILNLTSVFAQPNPASSSRLVHSANSRTYRRKDISPMSTRLLDAKKMIPAVQSGALNLRAKFVSSIGLLGLLCLLPSGSLRAGTLNFDSIDTSASPYYLDITTTDYLAQFGITLANVTVGTVDVVNENLIYGNAPSPPNVLAQIGSDFGESYTLEFSTPLSSLSFDLPAAASDNLFAAWSVTAYDAGNDVLSSAGDANLSLESFTVQSYTLNGPGIAYATFSSQCEDACGVNLEIDDLSSPDLNQTPEPSSLLPLSTGIVGVMGAVRRKWFS